MAQNKISRLIYVADPMCPWSYGFMPEVSKIKAEYDDIFGFELVMGGLRPGKTEAISERTRRMIENHWMEVEEVTSLKMNFNYFMRERIVFDTEPACRAVVAVRHIMPQFEFELFKALERGFFHDGADLTHEDSILDVLLEFHVPEDTFLRLFHSEEIKRATREDFALARKIGADVFPCLYLQTPEELILLTKGFRTYDQIHHYIEDLMDEIRLH